MIRTGATVALLAVALTSTPALAWYNCAELNEDTGVVLQEIGHSLSSLNNLAELRGDPHFEISKFTQKDYSEFVADVAIDCMGHPLTPLQNAVRAEYGIRLLSDKPYVRNRIEHSFDHSRKERSSHHETLR